MILSKGIQIYKEIQVDGNQHQNDQAKVAWFTIESSSKEHSLRPQ